MNVAGYPVQVLIGGVAATSIVVVNDTTITAVTSANTAGLKNVLVRNVTSQTALTNSYTYAAAPTIASISPTAGRLTGEFITLTGTNLTGATALTVGGVAATGITVVNATTITAFTPAGTAGAKDVVVTTPGGNATLAGGFSYVPAPTITSIAPGDGPLAGGTVVTVTGTGFLPDTSVDVDDGVVLLTGADVTIISSTSLTFTTPAHAAGAVSVKVYNAGGVSNAAPGNFISRAAPTLTSVSPNSGPAAGGATMTITGTNLTGATALTIGGAAATNLTVVNATTLSATTPAGTAGAKDVVVTTPGGSATLTNGYTYEFYTVTPPIYPATAHLATTAPLTMALSDAPPTGVTITPTGTNLVFSPSSIAFGPGETSKTFTVLVTSGAGFNPLTINYGKSGVDAALYAAIPSGSITPLGRVSPPSYLPIVQGATSTTKVMQLPVAAPSGLTVTPTAAGLTFTPATITFNAGLTNQFFTYTADANATPGPATITYALGGANAANFAVPAPGTVTILAQPSVASVSPDAGPLAGGQPITLTGTNLTGATAVTIGGAAATNIVVVNDTTITATTPVGTAGARDVVVTTPGGNATLASGYTYFPAPLLTGVSPSSGPTTGGQTVTLTGTNLTGATIVLIVGVQATNVTVINSTTVTAVMPALPAGTYNVSIGTPGGAHVLANAYTAVAAPTLTSISPAGGTTAGGAGFALTGSGFTGATSVTIGGVAATSVAVINDNTITAISPAGAAGVKDVAVTAPGGTATLVAAYTHVAPPTVTAITPSAGPLAGGQSITITGTNFVAVSGAGVNGLIGGAALTSLVIVNDTTITAITPARPAGAKNVFIGTAGGNATLTNGYTYVAAPTLTALAPSGGPTAGGNSIEVNGTNLSGVTAVTFDGVPATNLTPVNSTRVLITAPPGTAGPANIAITASGGTTTLANGYTYFAPPTLTAVSPNAGPVAGGQTVILTGTNFDTVANGVRFGTQYVPYTINSPTQITATTPAASAGIVDVVVGDSYFGTATLANGYTFVAAPTLTAIAPNAGSPAGGQSVTLTGTNLTGVTSVTFDGAAATAITLVNATTITATTPAGSAGYTYGVPQLALTAGDLAIAGDEGGANWTTTSPTTAYTIENTGSDTLTWSASLPGFLSATPLGGTLQPGETAPLAPAPNATANALTPGVYTGTITVTSNGGTQTRNVTLTVRDATAPVLATGPSDITVNTDPGLATAVVTYTAPTFTDNVAVASVTQTAGLTSGAAFPLGVTTNSFRASDAAGNTTDYAFTVTVGDAEAPVLAAGPGNIAVSTDPGLDSAVVTFTVPTFTDNVGVTQVTQIVGLASGAAFPLGVTTNTFRAADAAGNTTDYSFTVSVGDAEAPVLASGPSNITVNTDPGLSTATVTYAAPAFTDNIGVTSLTRTAGLASGSAFPVGTTTVTHRASDAAGNTADHSFTVTVTDAEPPVLANVPANITISVDVPATSAMATWTPPTATDNAPGVTVTRTGGPAPGSTFPLGTTTITYRATDAAGNTVDASFTVTVSQTPPGSATIVVNSDEDGSFGITSNAPGLSGTIATSGGTGSRGPVALPPGTYTLAFTTPAGFGVASASCTAGGTLNAASQTGTLTVASNANVICTIDTLDALGESTAALGSYLETRASLVVQNAPEVSRRLDRLTGGGGAGGGISGFGVSMGAGVLPFSLSLGADEMSFSTSLIGAGNSGRTGLPRQPRVRGESIADPLGDQIFGLAGDNLLIGPLDDIRPGSGDAVAAVAPGAVRTGGDDPMAHRFDIWVEGRFARFDAAGGEGTFGILHFGADYLVTPNLLLGVGLQFDWLREDTILGGDIDGQGYLAGPYLTARLAENLYLDLRAAWGTADTDVSPFGTYVDTVESDRTLITGALIGDYRSGAWTIRPEARLTWYREETDAYTDSLNVAIPAIRVETGYLEFGPEFGYVVELEDGASLRPNVTLQGVWTFTQDNTAAAPSNAPGLADTGLRGRAELGLAYQSAGFSLAVATYYDGIGDNDFEAWGGRIKFSLGF